MTAARATLELALIQLNAGTDVQANLTRALVLAEQAFQAGAEFVLLPENFAYMGPDHGRLAVAERLPNGPLVSAFAALARRFQGYLLLGGIPEVSPEPPRTYNTAVLLDPSGACLAYYRKLHLFDVTLNTGASYRESSAVLPGTDLVTASVHGWSVGLSICYDLRFPELYRALSARGVDVVTVPAAFTARTGEAHWEPLLRARAIENLCYVAAPGQWGQHGRQQTFGHSMVVSPWGEVLATLADGEGVVRQTLQRERLHAARRELPCLSHRRLG